MKTKVEVGDLLYHSVHGMCRVKQVLKKTGNSADYALVPQLTNRTNLRYVVPHESLEESGFRKPVSAEEAEQILSYFRTGKRKEDLAANRITWAMAENMLTCSKETFQCKDQRTKMTLQKNAFGLVREIASVLNLPLRAAVNLIQKNLRGSSRLNPTVVTALEKAVEE
jgi:hypothetical protein